MTLPLEMGLLAYAGIFLGVLMAFEGLRQVLSRSETLTETRNRRMRMIAKGATAADVLALLKPGDRGWALGRLPLIGPLPARLRQAGLTIGPGRFLLLCAGVAAVAGGLASVRLPPLTALAMSLALGVLLPMVVLRSLRRRRLAAMERQLPDALDLMARGLKIGHPLNTTIAAVAETMADPIATEFGIMVDQISYGEDLVTAFADFADRCGLEDVRYLAVSVAIQNGTGGNLGDVLHTLAKVIRDRMAMRKRILAVSSEGRLTSTFLSLLPVFILGVTSITSPDYYSGVKDDPLFLPMAITVAGLTVANFLIMRRLVTFRI